MDYSQVVTKITILVILMVIGFFFDRRGIFSESFKKTANYLLVNFFVVMTVLNSALNASNEAHGANIAWVFLVLTGVMIVTYIIGEIAARVIPCTETERPSIALVVGAGNNILVGIPVAQAILGDVSTFYIALTTIPYSILLYSYGIWRMQRAKKTAFTFRKVFNPPCISALVALLIFVIRPPVPGIVKDLVSTLSAVTLPLSMLLTGASLGASGLIAAFRNKRVYLVNLFRLIINPVIVWLLMSLITSDPILICVAMIIAGSPGAIMVTVLAIEYGCDAKISSETILVGTIISMITMPLLVFLAL